MDSVGEQRIERTLATRNLFGLAPQGTSVLTTTGSMFFANDQNQVSEEGLVLPPPPVPVVVSGALDPDEVGD